MATTYDRWFVVPPKTFEETDGDGNVVRTRTAPKYSDVSGVSGFSGNLHFFDQKTYSNLPWSGTEMYVVRFYGSDEALNTVAGNEDAYGKVEYGLSDSDVAGYLNDRFGDNLSFGEWIGKFNVG